MTDSLEPKLAACGCCGKPATGHAKIGEQRYCHGDDEPAPTCYMRAQTRRESDLTEGAAAYVDAMRKVGTDQDVADAEAAAKRVSESDFGEQVECPGCGNYVSVTNGALHDHFVNEALNGVIDGRYQPPAYGGWHLCAGSNRQVTEPELGSPDSAVNVRQYRKRPVVIDAMRWDGSEHSEARIVTWSRGKISGWFDSSYFLKIHTLEGDMRADPGDWIIRGVAGEFYPCKPEIFEATYESI